MRLRGMHRVAALEKQLVLCGTCFRRFIIISPAVCGRVAASEGGDGEGEGGGDGGAGAAPASSSFSSAWTSPLSWPPSPVPSAGGRRGIMWDRNKYFGDLLVRRKKEFIK